MNFSYRDYLEMVRDPDVEDGTILTYQIIWRGEGVSEYELRANPAKVEMKDGDFQFESAMKIGNNLARYRRPARFRRLLADCREACPT